VSIPTSGLFVGSLRHRRFSPVAHAFRYPVFQFLLDVDRVRELMAISRLTSYNRWNWAAFCDNDHFGDPARPLRERLHRDARRAGVVLEDGPIFLLTNLRYLGYVFNPISFYYCYTLSGRVQAVMAEVNNTFGGSHNYWLADARLREDDAPLRFTAPKALHVSPFMPMAVGYEFALSRPGDRLAARISTVQDGALTFDATLALKRRPWTAGDVLRALLRHPFMTGKVMAAIHLEALRLYWKKVPFYPNPHPAPGSRSASRISRP